MQRRVSQGPPPARALRVTDLGVSVVPFTMVRDDAEVELIGNALRHSRIQVQAGRVAGSWERVGRLV